MWYVCVFLQSHPFLLASIEYYSRPNGDKKFISFLNLLPRDISTKNALSFPFLQTLDQFCSMTYSTLLLILPWDAGIKDALLPIPADPGSVLFYVL